MNEQPKISIVTINKNGGKFLGACMDSILQQNYPELEYILVDGASIDNSLDVIEVRKQQLSAFTSEKDNGPADALNKGLQKSTGEIMAWLNSDDMLHEGSLDLVAKIFQRFPQVDWIMGTPSYFDENDKEIEDFFINQELTPRPPVVTKSMYKAWSRWSKHRYYNGDILSVQQESVFWRRGLWEKAGSSINTNCGPAFDLELWLRFFRHAQLFTTNRKLGGFRYHSDDQLSIKHREVYLKNAKQLIAKELSSFSEEVLKDSEKRWRESRLYKPFFYFDIPVFGKAYSDLLELPPFISVSSDKELRMIPN